MVARRTTTNTWRITRKRKARGRPPCHICHQPIDYDDRTRGPRSYELDHITEVADGGTDDDSNLAPACRACHLAKTAQNNRKRGSKWSQSALPVNDPRNNRSMRDW